jgi:glutaredoxin
LLVLGEIKMKKILSIIILGLLLTGASGLFLIQSSAEKNRSNNFATHTVLGEYGTATWCGYCKYAHGALKAIYKGGWQNFNYVSLVCDKNTHAYYRAINQLGLTGYPTVFWDGNYLQNVGAGSIPGAMAAYNASIDTCEARTVANVDLSISVTWLGNAQMSITVTVTNNQGSAYNGYLLCYVTEIASSMGWFDVAGDPYTFPFLDYAFDQSISAPASGTWSNTVTWDGALHNDGYGNTFGGITEDNTFIIASVFASSGGYVDETAAYRVGSNRPPNAPNTPNPANGATNVKLNPTLSWKCTDPDWFDDLYFDVYFEKDDPTPDVLVSDDQTGLTYDPGTLDMESTYYWQIIAHDEYGLTVNGPIWHFTTRGNSPPNTPKNPTPSDGATNIPIKPTLHWTGGDPDSDTVTYDVYFDAENPNPTTLVSNNQTGTTYKPSQLEYNTSYYWKIVAEDTFGEITEGPIWSFTTMAEPSPDLKCTGTLVWNKVKPGSTVTGSFLVQNIGDPTSELNWRIDDYPSEWGNWTFNPDHEDGLTPEEGETTVTVTVVAPLDKNTEFTGEVKIINVDDPSDFEIIPITLKTPRDINFHMNILERILEKFPNIFPLLRYIMGI